MPPKDFKIGKLEFTHKKPGKQFEDARVLRERLGGRFAWCKASKDVYVLAIKPTKKQLEVPMRMQILQADMVMAATEVVTRFSVLTYDFGMVSGYLLLYLPLPSTPK